MTTARLCVKCNKHYAVFGQDYCPKHGGVVPKTIKEYEELRDAKIIGPATLYVNEETPIDWMAEAMKMPLQVIPKDDRLSELREWVSQRASRTPPDHYSSEWEDGWDHGASSAYQDVLRLIDSMSPYIGQRPSSP